MRIAVDDGRRFLGRQIANKDLAETLRKLDVESSTARMPGHELIKAVTSGREVDLSNGWKLVRSRVSNDNRVEIDLNDKFMSMALERQLDTAGVITERINWVGRYFVPSDPAKGGAILDSLLQKINANAVAIKDAGDAAPAFSRGAGVTKALPKAKGNKVRAILPRPERRGLPRIGSISLPDRV